MSMRKLTATAAALTVVLTLGGCKTVTGRIWLPVYANSEDAVGKVTVHFTADCPAAGRKEPLVRLRYLDSVANVSFDAEGDAPLCSDVDTLSGIYGRYHGFLLSGRRSAVRSWARRDLRA